VLTEPGQVEAEQRLHSLFINHPDAVFVLDEQGCYAQLNPACERLTGLAPETLLGTPCGARARERQVVLHGVRVALSGQSITFEATVIGRERREVPVQVTLVPIEVNGAIVGVYGITRDISPRKRVEQRLATHARQQTAVADLGLLALTDIGTSELLRITVEVVADTLEVNSVALLELESESSVFRLQAGVGIPESLINARLSSRGLNALLEQPESTRIRELNPGELFGTPGLEVGDPTGGLATRVPGRESTHGLLIAWSKRARATSDDDLRFLQQVAIVLGAAIDQYQAADELRRRESELKVLVEHTADNIVRFDRLLRFMYVNPALERMVGLGADRLIGRTMREVGRTDEQDLERWERALRRVFRSGEEDELESMYGERSYHVRLSPEFGPDAEVNSVLGVGRDITAERRREAERSKLYQELLERDTRLHALVERVLLNQRGRPEQRPQSSATVEQFNARERRLLRLLARGMTNRQIGLELDLRPGTVKNYVANLLPRLNANDRTHAAVVAAQLGLLGEEGE
jgi:PAS domain S-box-containing protein